MFRHTFKYAFTTASAISLLLTLVLAVIWIRSYWFETRFTQMKISKISNSEQELRTDWYTLEKGRFIWSVSIMQTRLLRDRADQFGKMQYLWEDKRLSPWKSQRREDFIIGPTRYGYRFLGFLIEKYDLSASQERGKQFNVPCWFLTLLFGIAPATWLLGAWRAYRRHHREELGLCLACGYDLRASKNRCPECGRAVLPDQR